MWSLSYIDLLESQPTAYLQAQKGTNIISCSWPCCSPTLYTRHRWKHFFVLKSWLIFYRSLIPFLSIAKLISCDFERVSMFERKKGIAAMSGKKDAIWHSLFFFHKIRTTIMKPFFWGEFICVYHCKMNNLYLILLAIKYLSIRIGCASFLPKSEYRYCIDFHSHLNISG